MKVFKSIPLLPCPFCGSEAAFEEIPASATDGVVWSVGCVDEDCSGYQSTLKSATRREAAAVWNKRPEALRRAIDAVREMLPPGAIGWHTFSISIRHDPEARLLAWKAELQALDHADPSLHLVEPQS